MTRQNGKRHCEDALGRGGSLNQTGGQKRLPGATDLKLSPKNKQTLAGSRRRKRSPSRRNSACYCSETRSSKAEGPVKREAHRAAAGSEGEEVGSGQQGCNFERAICVFLLWPGDLVTTQTQSSASLCLFSFISNSPYCPTFKMKLKWNYTWTPRNHIINDIRLQLQLLIDPNLLAYRLLGVT